MSILWMVGGFILVLSPIIIVHELGHFLTARWFGIKVEEFGLGYPPRAVTLFERQGTKFTLNWIPFGGFVRPVGEDDPSVPGGLASASKTARFSVLIAGSAANFVLAFFVLWGAFIVGPPQVDENRIAITSVQTGAAGDAAGLRVDDVIVAINGITIAGDDQTLIDNVRANPGRPVELVVLRGDETLRITATPAFVDPDDPAQGGILGIGLSYPMTGGRDSMALLPAARESLTTMRDVVQLTIQAPVMLIRGQLSPQDARPIGIVGMSQIIGVQAQSASSTGDFFGLLFFAGIINLGLAVTNLLPIPALDGGRILFVIIEAIRGRRIEPEREGLVHMVGMLLLLGLMVLIIIQDVVNPIIPF